MSAKRKFWLAGLGMAGVGVLLARVMSPRSESAGLQLALFALGTLLAIAGLGIIMFGIKKSAEK